MAEQHSKKKSRQFKGGYECSFVEEFPKDFESECPVCLHILCEPYMVGCCGYRFCRACIQPIQQSTSVCPLCKLSFSSLPDKQLERILNDKLVYCSFKEGGCEWKDKLRALQKHLKTCGFKAVPCSYCSSLFQRLAINKHENTCPLKPVECVWCGQYSDILSKLKSKHYPKCPMFPVSCPNNCGAKPYRKNVAAHIDNVCPNTVLDCFFRHIGCEVQLPRKEMTRHSDEMFSEHLLASKRLVKQLKVENVQLGDENTKLKEREHSKELFSDQLVASKKLVKELRSENAELLIENTKLKRELELSNALLSDHLITSKTQAEGLRGKNAELWAKIAKLEKELGQARMSTKQEDHVYLSVTNLPPTVNESMLRGVFGQYGRVESLFLSEDRKLGRVLYADYSSAQQALSKSKEGNVRLKSHNLCVSPVSEEDHLVILQQLPSKTSTIAPSKAAPVKCTTIAPNKFSTPQVPERVLVGAPILASPQLPTDMCVSGSVCTPMYPTTQATRLASPQLPTAPHVSGSVCTPMYPTTQATRLASPQLPTAPHVSGSVCSQPPPMYPTGLASAQPIRGNVSILGSFRPLAPPQPGYMLPVHQYPPHSSANQ